ncbi:uncharacterized protein LOC111703584 [Eurytemora carolleeae]|uniref:uncharacterized protein LOC111703584 n=1 Tax=Eurytemora carolleeae TaxID=1294199 RepID=UPI000C784B9A|nr:uncharacterized protein LOC111703584 [Eurytemora carolleeae]|eukprot:XP_023331339.1 uncharacterized protein LOC111703584 [Eurytemora affinis]
MTNLEETSWLEEEEWAQRCAMSFNSDPGTSRLLHNICTQLGQLLRPNFESAKNAESMETILGEEFIKTYIYPNEDNLKISDESWSKKEKPNIQTLEHLQEVVDEQLVAASGQGDPKLLELLMQSQRQVFHKIFQHQRKEENNKHIQFLICKANELNLPSHHLIDLITGFKFRCLPFPPILRTQLWDLLLENHQIDRSARFSQTGSAFLEFSTMQETIIREILKSSSQDLNASEKLEMELQIKLLLKAGKLTGQSQKGKCAWVVPFVENHFHSQEKKKDVEMKKESSAIFHQPPERILITRYLLFLQTFYPSRSFISEVLLDTFDALAHIDEDIIKDMIGYYQNSLHKDMAYAPAKALVGPWLKNGFVTVLNTECRQVVIKGTVHIISSVDRS